MKYFPHLQPPITQSKPSRQEDSPKALFQGRHSAPCLQRNRVQLQQRLLWLLGAAHLPQPQTQLSSTEPEEQRAAPKAAPWAGAGY